MLTSWRMQFHARLCEYFMDIFFFLHLSLPHIDARERHHTVTSNIFSNWLYIYE